MKRAPRIVPSASRPAGWVVEDEHGRYLRVARTGTPVMGSLALATVFNTPGKANAYDGAVLPVYAGASGRWVSRQRTPSPMTRAVCPDCARSADHNGGIPHTRSCARRKVPHDAR